MKVMTMVARGIIPGSGPNQYAYTLVDEEFKIYTMPENNIIEALRNKRVEITNLGLGPKGIAATNGAMEKYTQFDATGTVVGKPRAVILSRLEKNETLVGYIVFTPDGVVNRLPLEKVVELCRADLIANGKLRPTSSGYIVSSIRGEYPIERHKFDKNGPTEVPEIEVTIFGSALKGDKSIEYAGIEIRFENAVNMSKIYGTLKAANIELHNKLKTEFGFNQNELQGLKMRQTVGAGIYGVYPLNFAAKIANNKFKVNKGGIYIVSCDDRTNGNSDEALVVCKQSKNSVEEVNRRNSSSSKANSVLEQYRTECAKRIGI